VSNQENGGLQVSVVMAVFNGERTLEATLASVLCQTGCSFEFIVIDDGSTDSTRAILERTASYDARLRVIRQTNTGLTKALIAGCNAARAPYIARQDCGDVSLPDRLETQYRRLVESGAAMVAGGVAIVAPDGELVEHCVVSSERLRGGLRAQSLEELVGPPHHGATMFRRDAYAAAGGYRAQFPVAQDIDLWLRMIDVGDCLGMDEIVYQSSLEQGSISDLRRDKQVHCAKLAVECAIARRDSGSDASALSSGGSLPSASASAARLSVRVARSRFNYFVGSCLKRRDPRAARKYFLRALRADPLHLRALVRVMGL
jgi:glycosyltransferase involved in cell wall biosynthesis